MSDYERRYFLTRDAADIAKFLAAHATWTSKVDAYRLACEGDSGNVVGFPKGRPSDKAKWAAYDAAGRVERLLGTPRSHTVSDLARTYAAAFEAARA